MIKKTFVALAIGLSVSASYAETLNFGIISTESSQNLRSDWQPVLDDLAKKTGMEVKPFFASDYAGVIEGMRFNKVQVAWFGNKSAMEAVDRADGEIFAQMVNADGTKGYYSHLIVHKDSPLKTMDDVLKNGKSLTFGIGDPNSTSGFLVPSFYVFAQNNINGKEHFKLMRSANHETNALAVANKQVDVATNNSENLEKVKEHHPAKFEQIKVVWTSPLIPSDPLVMRKDLPEGTKAKIKDFFYSYGQNDVEKANLMKLSKISGFKPSTNDQLKPIRQLALFSKRNKIEADASLSADDKKSQLAAIDQKLAALK